MTQINQIKCDYCKKKVPSRFNGEHHLPPRGWAKLVDTETERSINEHVCPDCLPRTPQNKHKREKKQ